MSRPSDAVGRLWLPGEVLPTRCECINDVNQLKESIHELITSMQTNILNEMNEVQRSLQLLSTRVTKSEADIAHLHVSLENIPSVETDSHTQKNCKSTPRPRTRKIRLEIQVHS